MTKLGTPQTLPTKNLTTYHHNPRKGNINAIAESLHTNGQYRPIVVNKGTHTGRPYEVLAGNHTLKAALKLHEEGRDDYTNIDAYVIDVTEEQAKKIVLADNRTSDLATYDQEHLVELLTSLDDVVGTAWDEDDIADLVTEDGDNDDRYVRDIEIPLYTPTMDNPPPVGALYDDTKTRELVDRINASDAPDGVKEFLRVAAGRHTVIDFRMVAEFYAHAAPEVQELMEDQALVIIDVEDAIRGGYAKLQDDVYAQRLADQGLEE